MTQQECHEAHGQGGRRHGSIAGWIPGVHRRTMILCLIAAHALVPKIAVAQTNSAGEYELKAAMLYNLTRFVEWPSTADAVPQRPLVLCILGRDPFEDSLNSVAAAASARGNPVEIRHFQDEKGIRACHVLYIGSSEKKNLTHIISALQGSNVLTVGEMGQFAAHGGMIQFSLIDQQVRFEINLRAASEAGLKISSRLLVLARIVGDKDTLPRGSNWSPSSRAFEFASLVPGVELRQRTS
ncbi:MAG TPA: YfiR family protein [Candidatus Acidoferrum sp.]|nr:YfiR family protein [Candidatus Acidoferrum sp.]